MHVAFCLVLVEITARPKIIDFCLTTFIYSHMPQGEILPMALSASELSSRDFRAKYPDDVVQENLPGQLWFGAEVMNQGFSSLGIFTDFLFVFSNYLIYSCF